MNTVNEMTITVLTNKTDMRAIKCLQSCTQSINASKADFSILLRCNEGRLAIRKERRAKTKDDRCAVRAIKYT